MNPWAVEAVIALQELGAWEALDSLRLQDTWQVHYKVLMSSHQLCDKFSRSVVISPCSADAA